MSPENLRAFVADVRAQVTGLRARLAVIDANVLPACLHAVHTGARRQAEELDALTEEGTIGMIEAACAQVGRELSGNELRGLFGLYLIQPTFWSKTLRSLLRSTHRCPQPQMRWKWSPMTSRQRLSK